MEEQKRATEDYKEIEGSVHPWSTCERKAVALTDPESHIRV